MKNFIALCAAGLMCSTVAASAATFECKLDMGKNGGNWMGPTVYVDYDEANGTATVIDGVIDHFVGDPIATTSILDNAKRITFTYELKTIKGSKRGSNAPAYANQIYTLTIYKASMDANIRMRPMRYSNTFRDQGSCIVT